MLAETVRTVTVAGILSSKAEMLRHLALVSAAVMKTKLENEVQKIMKHQGFLAAKELFHQRGNKRGSSPDRSPVQRRVSS